MSDYPREATEYIFVNATVDGVHVTQGVELSVVPQVGTTITRPDTWTPAIVVDGRTGFLETGRNPGLYRIWARITTTDSPEIPVIDCGLYRIS